VTPRALVQRCRVLFIAVLACCLSLCANAVDAELVSSTVAVLVFTKTAGYRHESIGAGIAAVKALGADHHVAVEATEAAEMFNDQSLAKYRAVIFLNTTGDVLDSTQRAALERFIRHGGGFVGIHSAADTEYGWPWYGRLVGAYFRSHPPIQWATLEIMDASHISTRHLPRRWTRFDEWYNFGELPAADVKILISIDETSYRGGIMGSVHPMAWYHSFDGGRAWYTALGHTMESYSDPLFLQHLWGGIAWAAAMAE